MKLKRNELRVFYNNLDTTKKGVETYYYAMDADIEKVLRKYGYVRWASGCELKTGLRELCFEKKVNK